MTEDFLSSQFSIVDYPERPKQAVATPPIEAKAMGGNDSIEPRSSKTFPTVLTSTFGGLVLLLGYSAYEYFQSRTTPERPGGSPHKPGSNATHLDKTVARLASVERQSATSSTDKTITKMN
jgi:hypothetical protein